MPERRQAERVTLTEDWNKILAAIAYVIACANKKGKEPTQYDIVKSIFLADRAHLNKWGRPITFDNYYAMKFGPVPSGTYDLLKENRGRMHRARIRSLPWERKKAEGNNYRYFNSNVDAFEDYLSPSERDALDTGVLTVLNLGFSAIYTLTHGDAAFREAWIDESESKSFQMSLGLLFETPDYEAARMLSEYSPYRY